MVMMSYERFRIMTAVQYDHSQYSSTEYVLLYYSTIIFFLVRWIPMTNDGVVKETSSRFD